jgi:hypothetical protein
MCCGKSAGPRKPNHSIRKLRVSTGSRGEEATLDLANTLRGLALAAESSAKPDASRAFWLEARQLYAKCKAEAGVAECDEKIAP